MAMNSANDLELLSLVAKMPRASLEAVVLDMVATGHPINEGELERERDHALEAAGQARQEAAFARTDFDGQVHGGQRQSVDQAQQWLAVDAEVGNQVLLRRGAIGKAGKELA